MPSHKKKATSQAATKQIVPSKDMAPLPDNFGPIFIQNQFRTEIQLPTTDRYPNVKGKCAIITGSNTGLGFEAAKQLLSLGLSRLVMAVRSVDKGEEAARRLEGENSTTQIYVWQIDMASYESIQSFTRKCQETLPQIDIVILNAGLFPMKFEKVSATGHETAIQINHLSTVLLAVLLLPILKSKSNGVDIPRVTIVSSVMAQLAKFPNRDARPLLPSFDDTKVLPFDMTERYGVSKLLCQLFTVELSNRVSSQDVIINMVDPGATKNTGLNRDAKGLIAVAGKLLGAVAGRPVEKGAATYIDAALGHGKESHGCFLMNCAIAPLACWYYSDGKALTDVIWEETISELRFAGVEEAIRSMQG